jgi:hypothetical protein
LDQPAVVVLVAIVLLVTIAITYISQAIVEQETFNLGSVTDVDALKTQTEIAKLVAEIRQIRSDTSGSLFWLKMIALFVTVGGAVGGYLVGQSRATRARIEFEDRKNVDAAYQSIVQELSDKSPLLRAAAAVKMGTVLKSFPHEWNVSTARQDQLIRLTKEVLAASLSIEKDPKVLKMITIALVLHHPWENDPGNKDLARYGDARGLDLSGAKAADAYWARVDFSGADFYKADLTEASFRLAFLRNAQFRDTSLQKAVFVEADCAGANFKLADLRGADLSRANLSNANFEGAKMYGTNLAGAKLADNPETEVDVSPTADGSQMLSLREWILRQSA